MRSPTLAAFLMTLSACAVLSAQRAVEQVAPRSPGYVAPRTPWGDPDFEGIWPGVDMVRVPIERPRQYGTRIFMSKEEQQVLEKRETEAMERMARNAGGTIEAPGHWVEWGRSQRQTSLIVDPPDGRLPPPTADGQLRESQMPRGSAGFGLLNSPADFTTAERCISRGVIGSTLPSRDNSGIEITQAPGYVAIRFEMMHDVRVIPLDGRPHLPPTMPTYMGDARGRWSGDTLIIDTRNLSPRVGLGVNGAGAPPSPAMRLTERLTRVGRDTIRYEATVNDPRTFTAPYTLAFPLTRMPGYIMGEYACHEGNLGLRFALSGARADEAKGMGK